MTRDQWLNYRHTGIGASEVGAIMGLDDYLSSLELYYYKIGDIAKFDTQTMSAFMGTVQEDTIADLWQYWDGDEESMIHNFQAGHVVRRCQRVNAYVRNPDYPWLYVSLDRKINKHAGHGEGNLELKTIGGWESDKWEAGLPPKYITQCTTQMVVCIFDFGEMAVLEDGRRFHVYELELRKVIAEQIVYKTREFWLRVEKGRKLVNEKYFAMTQYNQRRVDELNYEIDDLAPEPDGTLIYADYLKKRFNRPSGAERRGSPQELITAQRLASITENLKGMLEMKVLQENLLKKSMGDHVQVLDFGRDGKVYWTTTQAGGRIFRNKVRELSK